MKEHAIDINCPEFLQRVEIRRYDACLKQKWGVEREQDVANQLETKCVRTNIWNLSQISTHQEFLISGEFKPVSTYENSFRAIIM